MAAPSTHSLFSLPQGLVDDFLTAQEIARVAESCKAGRNFQVETFKAMRDFIALSPEYLGMMATVAHAEVAQIQADVRGGPDDGLRQRVIAASRRSLNALIQNAPYRIDGDHRSYLIPKSPQEFFRFVKLLNQNCLEDRYTSVTSFYKELNPDSALEQLYTIRNLSYAEQLTKIQAWISELAQYPDFADALKDVLEDGDVEILSPPLEVLQCPHLEFADLLKIAECAIYARDPELLRTIFNDERFQKGSADEMNAQLLQDFSLLMPEVAKKIGFNPTLQLLLDCSVVQVYNSSHQD